MLGVDSRHLFLPEINGNILIPAYLLDYRICVWFMSELVFLLLDPLHPFLFVVFDLFYLLLVFWQQMLMFGERSNCELLSEGLFFQIPLWLKDVQVDVKVEVDSSRVLVSSLNYFTDYVDILAVLPVGYGTDGMILLPRSQLEIVAQLFLTQVLDPRVVRTHYEKPRL